MQVFVVGEKPFETAVVLDKRRLNKQIVECGQILSAIEGKSKGWRNHPVVEMYRNNIGYLKTYLSVLKEYKNGNLAKAKELSDEMPCEMLPKFFCTEYFANMKSRLFTKDEKLYSKFAEFGKSYVNMYYVDEKWKHYVQREGK